MAKVELITQLHTSTKRNCVARVAELDKPKYSAIARQFEKDYWDGDRNHGYGGYTYDGRWSVVAKALIEKYELTEASSVLDVGCGKGFLLYEIKKLLPGIKITGFDISEYGIENCKPEIKEYVSVHKAQDPFSYQDDEFDLVISINTVHNLYVYDLKKALMEIERVGKQKYITMESYRNEVEKNNLLCWQLTCECFYTPEEWEWLFKEFSYTGDYEFIYFE